MRSKLISVAALALAAGGGWVAATLAQPVDSVPRFRQLTMAELTPEQKPLGEAVMKVSSVGIGGPYNLLLRSPVLGQKVFEAMDYLRWHTSVPTRLNEFAILIVGRQWRNQVEWAAHAPIAEKAGLSPRVIAELKTSKRPSGMAEDEAVTYDFVTELTTQKQVSDATFARAQKVFNEQQIVDLVAVTGTYVMLAMQMNMANQGLPPGRTPAFAKGEP
jgi:4-carboxymuconolactone decarboxylase